LEGEGGTNIQDGVSRGRIPSRNKKKKLLCSEFNLKREEKKKPKKLIGKVRKKRKSMEESLVREEIIGPAQEGETQKKRIKKVRLGRGTNKRNQFGMRKKFLMAKGHSAERYGEGGTAGIRE